MVKPILTYGGETWIQDFTNAMDFNENKWEITTFEQTHTKACRNALGIRANASGIATKAELGRYPLIINLVNQSLKFYSKTMMDERKLAYNALASEIELHNMGKHSWITTINKICNTATKQSNKGLPIFTRSCNHYKTTTRNKFSKVCEAPLELIIHQAIN